jgi:hypothetical protein
MRTLDQNQLSKRDLLLNSTDAILIPDVTWFENIKSLGWKQDVEKSFEAFHHAPDRLHVAFPIGALLRQEIQTRTATTDPVNWEATNRLRGLLREKDYVSLIEANVESLKQAGLEPLVNLTDNRQTLEEGMAELSAKAGTALMANLRSIQRAERHPLSDFTQSIVALTLADLPGVLLAQGLKETESTQLLSKQSAFYRLLFCHWAQIFRYAMDSPVLQRGDKKLLNDIVDSDYAIIASYTDDLVPDDKGLRERYEALVSAVTPAA